MAAFLVTSAGLVVAGARRRSGPVVLAGAASLLYWLAPTNDAVALTPRLALDVAAAGVAAAHVLPTLPRARAAAIAGAFAASWALSLCAGRPTPASRALHLAGHALVLAALLLEAA
jgi:hypothetical protein